MQEHDLPLKILAGKRARKNRSGVAGEVIVPPGTGPEDPADGNGVLVEVDASDELSVGRGDGIGGGSRKANHSQLSRTHAIEGRISW